MTTYYEEQLRLKELAGLKAEVHRLRSENAALRAEIQRLTGLISVPGITP